ncbi:MAG: hypothetical protein COA43_08395 [Robiginitomaculum sp.]|nr:MAG: hypothetical protein COA43_08395 [Robiginitomaculum sp.]
MHILTPTRLFVPHFSLGAVRGMLLGLFSLALTSLIMCISISSSAQTPSTVEQLVLDPQNIEKTVNAQIKALEENNTLSSEDIEKLREIHRSTLTRLSDGEASKTVAKKYVEQFKNSAKTIEDWHAELKKIHDELDDTNRDVFKEIEGQKLDLLELEHLLVQESSGLIVLKGELVLLEAERINLDKFSTDEPVKRADNNTKITELSEQIRQQRLDTLDVANAANHTLAQASVFARQEENKALDARKNGLSAERTLLADLVAYKSAQIRQKADLVNVLQISTGSARAEVAEQMQDASREELRSTEGKHGSLHAYAVGNLELSDELLVIAKAKENIPKVEANIKRLIEQVKFDSLVANQILGTKKTSRNYGVHLRQLRQKQPNIPAIRSQIKHREVELQDVLFKKIIYQEALATFNARPLDLDQELQKYTETLLIDDGGVVDLTSQDISQFRSLYDSRREILNALAYYSELKTRKLEEVNALQTALLNDITTLCVLLDGRLLWLPSTESVGFSWPKRVLQGVQTTFGGGAITTLIRAFWQGLKKNYFFAFLVIIFFSLSYVFRERFREKIQGMSSRVGRVQKDSYALTPFAILDGVVRSFTWVLIFIFVSVMLTSSDINTNIVAAATKTCFELAGITFVFLTIREWCRKNSLFELHFHVDKELRHRLIKHIPWLLATQAIGVILIGLTRYNLDYNSGASALGVLGFLIGAIGITVFTVKIAWARTKAFRSSSRIVDGIYLRYEKWFFFIAMVLPSATAILAVSGYYDTAQLLLSRFFLSFCVFMLAYVVHGVLRRTVVIAQRRFALEQAKERRDQAVKLRMEKVAAEERGEILVPKLDYDQIDLETIKRQSIQLVNITVVIITFGALWGLWSSFLPALSVFNDIEIWDYPILDANGVQLVEEGLKQKVSISVWNMMQAFGIGIITWLAARNLPGFLEIFVLKRMNFAQSSRFAIVTVLGYIIFIIGVMVSFDKIGVQWAKLQWIVAALSVGVGLGLQAIFANFVSGLIILFERPVRIGDYITVGDIEGTVTRIQIRATTLMDLDNKETLIPNQELVSQRVTNWTLTNSVTRMKIKVGIAYGSDTKLAHAVMLETIKNNPNVLTTPEPSVLFLGFGDSTLDFEIRVFLRDFIQRYRVSHELHMALDAALNAANIEIAFPQRDLHIKNPEALLNSLQSPAVPQKVIKATQIIKPKRMKAKTQKKAPTKTA